MSPLTLRSPKTVTFGRGRASSTGDHAAAHGEVALLVTDPTILELGVADPVIASLDRAGLAVERFDGVRPEPTLSSVLEALEAARAADADVVVGVGGGSAMDVAKAVAVLLGNPDLVSAPFGRNHVPEPSVPSILLPTTAGTGAEVSPAVVLVDDRDGHEKRGIVDDHGFATVALVDPALTDDLPPSLTAATGLDAFAHAVGSFISTSSNPYADALCAEAMVMIEANLRSATFHGADAPAARDAMALAATLAMLGRVNGGKAAIHAVAYGVQARSEAAHAAAIAAVLPAVLRYTLPACVPAMARLGTRCYGATGDPRTRAERFVDGVERLRDDLGLPASLEAVGVPADVDLDALARASVQSTRHLEATPRPMTAADARELLETLR